MFFADKEVVEPKDLTQKHGKWRLDLVLVVTLFVCALGAAGGLFALKVEHDRAAHRQATAYVLDRGDALLDALSGSGIACSTNSSPAQWRRFSMIVDNVFAVRRDVQSVSVSRDGVTIFHRQTDGAAHQVPAGTSRTSVSQRVLDIAGERRPVIVLSRATTLADGSRVVAEASFRREAVGAEERTGQGLVASMFALSLVVLGLSFVACAVVLVIAVRRDLRREKRARQEEHLAFSGVMANGILHDFRNPMSAVRLDAQMLGREMARAEGCRPERVHELADRLARTVGRMDKVFQEFLFLAKPADETAEPVDLVAVARECADTLAPRAEQAGVTLAAVPAAELPPAAAHPFALRRALLNVMTNAIQFAPRGSAVEVAFAADAKAVTLDVLDRGPGVAPGMREKIFEAFVTGRPEGTGLGLFLARTALRRAGGDLRALARPGGGSDFRLTLPRVVPVPTGKAVPAS